MNSLIMLKDLFYLIPCQCHNNTSKGSLTLIIHLRALTDGADITHDWCCQNVSTACCHKLRSTGKEVAAGSVTVSEDPFAADRERKESH